MHSCIQSKWLGIFPGCTKPFRTRRGKKQTCHFPPKKMYSPKTQYKIPKTFRLNARLHFLVAWLPGPACQLTHLDVPCLSCMQHGPAPCASRWCAPATRCASCHWSAVTSGAATDVLPAHTKFSLSLSERPLARPAQFTRA